MDPVWFTLDMETKIAMFDRTFQSVRVPPYTPLRRRDTSYGGRVAERACPDAPVKRRVTFQDMAPRRLDQSYAQCA